MVQLDCSNGVNNDEIKDINKLLEKLLGKNQTIVKTETRRLTAAGENYGSQMLAVDVHIKNNDTNGNQILHAVAKMCPPNEWLKKLFSTSVTFKKEIEFYTSIVPAMKEFEIEQGVSVIDCFPKCYAARVSLNQDSNIVDDNAVLLLENLKISEFQVVDRMEGFNLKTTKMILNDLAAFHAVPIAIKLLKPEVFNKRILPHLDRNRKFDNLSESAEKEVIDALLKAIQIKKECVPFLYDIKHSLQLCLRNFKNSATPREPFATINHNDYWVNNTMIKMDTNGQLVKNKILDFQLIDYGSPGNDIVFLLFSSVQKEVLYEHYDALIKMYYNQFIQILKELKCDTTKFTFEKLQEEIEISAKNRQLLHILVMLKHILAVKGKVKELSEMTEEDIISEAQISDEYRKKVPEIAYEFVKRKWIHS